MKKLIYLILILALCGCREIKEGHEQRKWKKEVARIEKVRKTLERPCADIFCDKELPENRYTFHKECIRKDDSFLGLATHSFYDCKWCGRDICMWKHDDCPNQDDKDKYWAEKEEQWRQEELRRKAEEWLAIAEKVEEIQNERNLEMFEIYKPFTIQE